jgi:hypothetical protein
MGIKLIFLYPEQGCYHHQLGKRKRFVYRARGLDIDRDVIGSRNLLRRNTDMSIESRNILLLK